MNNKVLKIVLVVLIIMVLALSGFIVYEKVLNKNNNVIDNNNKVNDNIKPDDNKTDCKLDTSLVSKFIGTYTYEGEYVEKYKNASGEELSKYENLPSNATVYEKLILNEDGSASASAGNVRAGGYSAEGKWYISNNELIIINNKCEATIIGDKVEYPNCQPIWSYPYEITNDNIIISSRNNSMVKVILNKVND
ncbi:MAG: hypothetical protein MR550_01440 [Bacilli bacterium]|nr:hypothetical protein [Bacilli bacterium]